MSTLSVTLTGIAPATLTLELGTPGPQGSTGPAGPTGPAGSQGIPGVGVPAGGTAGQFLTKIDGTNYNTDWTTVNLAAYAPLASPLFTGDPRGPTAALGDNDTSLATTAFVQQELLSGTANAKNLEVYVRNQTGSTIPAGSIVYINGATGNRPTITLAQANNDANSAQTFGFTKISIANNGTGYVIVRGELENIDTSAVTEGVQLYLSPTTAGTWTTTKPSAPQHLVYVGICVRAHPTQGVILVAVQNGYELPELHDVKITSPTNGQVLKYDSAQSLWVNGTDASGVAWGAITGTLTSQTDLNTALGLKYDASNPSGFITSSALSPYLTSATAASTYQTISGMSDYLTTASAASTYQTQSGMSDYLAKAGNLSGLSSNSTSRTNLGLGTIATVNDAPSDGSTYGRNNGAWVVAGGGGGASTDFQVYTTPGTSTWTKPAGAKWVEIVMFGGGGAGASGGRYATTSGRFGGGGGGGGPVLIAKVAASALGATETVVVGAGGTGGPSTTTDTTLGTAGTQGGSSSFSIFTAIGGNGGTGGGNIGTSPGGTAVVGWVTGVTGASSSAGGTAPATNTAGAQGGSAIVNSFVATGGGSGSGNVANNTGSNNGGNGGQKNASNTTSAGTPLILGGTAGTTAGVAPTTGVTGVGLRGGGTGGGGGAYRTAQAGMAGAVGAAPGGGGGGGSASDNGFASGAGGAGGAGAVYIITYC